LASKKYERHSGSPNTTCPNSEIANNWAERGYINAKHLLMLERAGMRDVAKIPPRWAPSKREARREAMRKVFDE